MKYDEPLWALGTSVALLRLTRGVSHGSSCPQLLWFLTHDIGFDRRGELIPALPFPNIPSWSAPGSVHSLLKPVTDIVLK